MAAGSGSSTTDYEDYTYDAASNVASERRRDGTTISYTYDALQRLTASNLPATSFTYDNLGRMLSATTATSTLGWTHDALNAGRFQYTGQAWISELGLYYYKAASIRPNSSGSSSPTPSDTQAA